MQRVSKVRTARAKRQTERYADCHGIPFAEYRFHLPERVSDWPQVVRVKDYLVEQKMHEWWGFCWNCGNGSYCLPEQTHHVIGGTKGRSDEFCNIAVLGLTCHMKANTKALPLGRVLFLKWTYDRAHTDWVRLALLARKHLPDLIP